MMFAMIMTIMMIGDYYEDEDYDDDEAEDKYDDYYD